MCSPLFSSLKTLICPADVWEQFYGSLAGNAYLPQTGTSYINGSPCDGQIEIGLTSGGWAWTIGCALSFVMWFGYLYVWSGMSTHCLLPTESTKRGNPYRSVTSAPQIRVAVSRTDGFIELMEQDELIHDLGAALSRPCRNETVLSLEAVECTLVGNVTERRESCLSKQGEFDAIL